MEAGLLDLLIEQYQVIILDGAMATELEKRGADLNHALWSAKLLIENPDMIKQVHLDYLKAGADIITSAGYQASFEGFAKEGIGREEAVRLMYLSTAIALDARAEFLHTNTAGSCPPLVAVSVGPYGASKADGSEYRGYTGITVAELTEFHKNRFEVYASSGADLLACETIPCIEEAEAIILALKDFPELKAWISFSCKNETELCAGTAFADAAALASASAQVVAVGVNCTAPQYIASLVHIGKSVTNKPIVVYPNRGDSWDAARKCWVPVSGHAHFAENAREWYEAGARLIGGCCQTSPSDIKETASLLRH